MLFTLVARGAEDLARLRDEQSRAVRGSNAPPVARILAQLAIAHRYVLDQNVTVAKQEYARAAAMKDAPAHLRREAEERIRELERREAGLPPRDSLASRTRLPEVPPPAFTFHVSPRGADGNPGTAERPFASLDRARDEIRSLKKLGRLKAGSVVVLVHGGEYLVSKTFTLGSEDSGTPATPIVYRAVPGEKPVFRGGVRLRGFHPVTDESLLKRLPAESRAKVMQVGLHAGGVTNLLPLKLGGFASGHGFKTHPAHELFYNGQALQLARGPNEGFLRIADVVVKDGTKGYDREGSKVGEFTYTGDLPARWAGEPDLLLYGYWFWDWADSYERVASIDVPQRRITLAKPYHNYGYSIHAPFYAINALPELDTPGEWYLDRASGSLLLYPPSDPNTAVVELSLFHRPMVAADNLSHVRFQELTWELGSADAIHLRGGDHVLFAGCTVRRFAGNGIEIHGGTEHGILSCDIYSLGRGGTIVSGGDRKTLTPGRHFIENCDIHSLSRIDHTYTPAVILSGVGNRIAHNRFHDVLSSALRVGGNDHLIEFNEIFEVVLESDDQGGADMYGNATYRGNVFRYNHWHHIGNWHGEGEEPKCGQAGIRLDDAISGTLVYGNIFERCSAGKLGFGGVQIHGGKDNIVDNNVFIDCAAAVSFSAWPEKRWREFVQSALESREIDQALYLERYPELAQLSSHANTNHIWRNVTLRCDEMFRRAPRSVEALENAALGEEKVRRDKRGLVVERVGFAPIPAEEIGLYRDAFRPDAKLK